jgi:Holliday junction resolvase RusA-like endonuclease
VATPQSSHHPTYPAGLPAAVVAGRAASLTLFSAGKPEPKGRPRARTVTPKDGRKAWVQIYTDEITVGWEERVEHQVKEQLVWLTAQSLDDQVLTLPFRERVLITLRFNLDKPKSTPKSVLFPVKSRSDVDNLAKAVLDALQNAGVLCNDNIVTDLMVVKRYSDDAHPQGVEVDVTGLL